MDIHIHFRTNKPLAKNGIKNGFQILLDAETYDYASSPSGGQGFILSILHHLDQPIMKNSGININTGHQNYLVVSNILMNTTQSAKSRFAPSERDCYFEDEITLQHMQHWMGFRYTSNSDQKDSM